MFKMLWKDEEGLTTVEYALGSSSISVGSVV